MEPLDFLVIFRQRWKIILAAVLVSAGLAWVTTPPETKAGPLVTSYTATATLLQQPGSSMSLPYVALLAQHGRVPQAAATALGYKGDPAALAASVSISTDPQLGTLTVTSGGPDGPQAAKVANTYAQTIITTLAQDAEKQRQAQIAELQTSIANAQAQVAQVQGKLRSTPNDVLLQAQLAAYQQQLTAAVGQLVTLYSQAGKDAQLSVLQQATPLAVTSGGFVAPRSHRGRLLLGVGVGLLLGLLLALIVDRIDTRLRRRKDVEEAFRLPVVAEVPRVNQRERRSAGIAVLGAPVGQVAEAYRTLRTALFMLPTRTVAVDAWGPPAEPESPRAANGPQVVLVTSARAGEGKSTTAANLAASLAETGKRVLVIDADFHKPSVHRLFDVPTGAGLADLLVPESTSTLDSLTRLTDQPRIRVLPAGHAAEYRGGATTRIAAVLAEARSYAQAVVIDAAPILGSSESMDFLPHVDAVVVVARLGRVNRPQAGQVADLLGRTRAPVLGVVCIGLRNSLSRYYPRSGPSPSAGSRSGSRSGSRRRRRRSAEATSQATSEAGSS